MALIRCWECDQEISSHASVCPKCGAPAPERSDLQRRAYPTPESRISSEQVLRQWNDEYTFVPCFESNVASLPSLLM